MNLKSIAKTATKLAVGAALTTGFAAVAQAETFTLAGNDPMSHSSLLTDSGAAGWKNESGTIVKTAPVEGNTYVVQGDSATSLRMLRTPEKKDVAMANGHFLFRNAKLTFKLNFAGQLTVADGTVESGLLELNPGDSGYRYYLRGNMAIEEDATLQVDSLFEGAATADPQNHRKLNVACKLTGTGLLSVLRTAGSPADPRDNVSRTFLEGDFSKFAGPVKFTNPFTATASVLSVDVVNANTFPGAMTTATSDGFVLDGGVKVNFLESGTIDFTRGVVFGPTANGKVPEINVAEGKTVKIDSVVSGVQGFVKTGTGRLEIGVSSDRLSGSVTVKEGTLAYVDLPSATVLADGGTIERIGVKKVRATATGYMDYEDDDVHGIMVLVDEDPGVDYAYEWSADGGEFGSEEPKFRSAGTHTVSCRVSADGYESVTVSAQVAIMLRTIQATLQSEATVTYDGEGHALDWRITDPVEGATLKWTVDGNPVGSTLAVTNPGIHSIVLCVTAAHYAEKKLSGTLNILYAGDMYASPTGGSGVPPYDAPEKACDNLSFLMSIAAANGTIHLAPGLYVLTNEAVAVRAVNVLGPVDRSAVISNQCLRLGQPGCFASGLTLTGGNDFMLRVTGNSTVSNCCVRNVKSGVSLAGRLIDSTVTQFSVNGVTVRRKASDMTRVAVTRGQIRNGGVAAGCAPIVIEEAETWLRMTDCDVSYNTNLMNRCSSGAIVSLTEADNQIVLSRCRFFRNSGRTGFLRNAPSHQSYVPVFATNCLVAECTSCAVAGSELNMMTPVCFSRGNFVNCTFANNSVQGEGTAGLFRTSSSTGADCTQTSVGLTNCVVSGNVNLPTGAINLPSAIRSIYPECPVDDAYGNLPGPALFRGRGQTPYVLAAGSPGVGAGDLLDWTEDDVDLAGSCRVKNGKIDMGCYQAVHFGTMILVR